MHRLREKTLWAWASGELQGRKAGRVEAHVKGCPRCAEAAAGYRQTLEAASSLRPGLPDEAEVRLQRNRLMARIAVPEFRPRRAWTPQWRAVAVFALGLLVGLLLRGMNIPSGQTLTVTPGAMAGAAFTGLEIGEAEGRPGEITLRYATQEEHAITGRLETQAVQCALALSLLSEPRDNVRLRHIDLLRLSQDSGPVLDALLTLARQDSNPGVRIKAVRLLTPHAGNPQVRETLLAVYMNDAVQGVRILAAQGLAGAHAPTLRDLLKSGAGPALALDPATPVRGGGIC